MSKKINVFDSSLERLKCVDAIQSDLFRIISCIKFSDDFAVMSVHFHSLILNLDLLTTSLDDVYEN